MAEAFGGAAAAVPGARPGGRILVVEDEQRLAQLLRLELSRFGHAVALAHDGLQGLQLAAEGGWTLVILDLMLPLLPGLEVCRRIRAGHFPGTAAPGAASVPIIMLTARDGLADRVAGLDAGADDFIGKPFHIEEVLARMRAVLRRRAGPPARAVLRVADLCLDPRARTAARAGTDISLTRREFDLLALLMENSPYVLTRDIILDRVWGYAYSGTSNIVDVTIRQLRDKIEAPGSPPLIQTVRGVGYALRADGPS